MRNPFRKDRVYVVVMNSGVWGVFSNMDRAWYALNKWMQEFKHREDIPPFNIYEVDYRIDKEYVKYKKG